VSSSSTMTVAEAAVELEMNHQQVLNRVKRGKLKGQKKGWFWLVKRSSVEAAKAQQAKK